MVNIMMYILGTVFVHCFCCYFCSSRELLLFSMKGEPVGDVAVVAAHVQGHSRAVPRCVQGMYLLIYVVHQACHCMLPFCTMFMCTLGGSSGTPKYTDWQNPGLESGCVLSAPILCSCWKQEMGKK